MENQSRERKNNKGRALIIVVAMILMLVLVVGMGAMTYARYKTSQSTGELTATAAKWGYVITVTADNLFGTDYTAETGKEVATVESNGNGVAVKALTSTTDNVVAPGTSGSMTIKVSGSAEVLAKLKISVKDGYSEIKCIYGINKDEYKPIVWTLTDKSISDPLVSGDFESLKSFDSVTFDAGQSIEKEYILSWEWALDGHDLLDTVIGYKSEGKSYDTISSYSFGTDTIGSKVATNDYQSIVTEMSFELEISIQQEIK